MTVIINILLERKADMKDTQVTENVDTIKQDFNKVPVITREQVKEIIDNALGNNLTGALIVRELVKLL